MIVILERGGFIQEQVLEIDRHGPGNGHPLALPPGKQGDRLFPQGSQSELLDQSVHPARRLAPGKPMGDQGGGHVFEHRPPADQMKLLGKRFRPPGAVVAVAPRPPGNRTAAGEHFSAGGRQQPGQHVQQGGFSRAGGTGNHRGTARLERGINPVENRIRVAIAVDPLDNDIPADKRLFFQCFRHGYRSCNAFAGSVLMLCQADQTTARR